ncbi:MAG: hypothetical protein HC808_14125 [Candidatus Competibacteraceae bacterium]|nr:hypothetical protein [Candidatus Competibacteraceae bacterium]
MRERLVTLVLVGLLLTIGFATAEEKTPNSNWWGKIQDTASGAWEDTRQLFRDESQYDFSRVWEQTLPKLEQALTLHDRHQSCRNGLG